MMKTTIQIEEEEGQEQEANNGVKGYAGHQASNPTTDTTYSTSEVVTPTKTNRLLNQEVSVR
jgi:hypothetical protein